MRWPPAGAPLPLLVAVPGNHAASRIAGFEALNHPMSSREGFDSTHTITTLSGCVQLSARATECRLRVEMIVAEVVDG